MAFSESSGGTRGIDEDEVGFDFGSEIFTLDFDFFSEEGLTEEWVEDVKIQRTCCKQAVEVWEVYKKVNRFRTRVEAHVWTVFG